ncbi:hypothetical protein [Acidiplasma cupricumulans]|nr:hypothetical protein [Acidiplasma cupricumulans]
MPALFNGIEFDSEKAINMIKNTTYATYNSRLEFNKTQNWKEAYKDTGNKIRNGIQLQDYIPEAETDHLDTKKMDDVLRENEKFIYSNINDFIKKIKKIVES